MVQVRYISGNNEGHGLTVQELEAKTGVVYRKLNPATYKTDGSLDRIRDERSYSFEDEIEICPSMPKYADKIASFHKEHLHADEEVRFVVKGATNFDVRDASEDSWIRITVTAGDLIILPAGLYHRLTLMESKPSVTFHRLFVWKPIWSCYFRPADDLDCRKLYLDTHKDNSVEIISST